MTDLIERLVAVTSTRWADNHDLNRDLMHAFGYVIEKRHIGCECWDYGEDDRCCPGAKHIDEVWVDPKTGKFVLMGLAMDFVGDTDKALNELKRLLPSCAASMDTDILIDPTKPSKGSAPFVAIYPKGDGLGDTLSASHGINLATALCIAILKAL